MFVSVHGARLLRLPDHQPQAWDALYRVTNDLVRRVHEHREGLVDGFTKKHGCKHLVWFELHGDIEAAILREKQVKKWLRPWKDALIEEANPDWRDLWWEIIK